MERVCTQLPCIFISHRYIFLMEQLFDKPMSIMLYITCLKSFVSAIKPKHYVNNINEEQLGYPLHLYVSVLLSVNRELIGKTHRHYFRQENFVVLTPYL